jgi:20S proteasome alpha/beta subunit
VTLVAGFRCQDGFVVAADPAIRYGDIVAQGHKLANYYGQQSKYDIVIGGAGDGVYVDMASQKIRDAVAGLPSPVLPTIKAEVQKLVFTIHDEYIFKFWEPEDSNRPSLALIIAIQDQQREWTLLHSDRDAVAEADEHAVVGTGSLLAEHLIEKIWIPSLSTAVTAHLAQQLFREMKGKSTYVGGNTRDYRASGSKRRTGIL